MWPFKNDAVVQIPIVERNLVRNMRPILLKLRRVKSNLVSFARSVGAQEEAVAHYALQVGDYCHELHTDRYKQKHLIHQRLTGNQIWESDLPPWIPGKYFMGSTDLTDKEINTIAKEVEDHLRSMGDGRYNAFARNCQHFTTLLWERICKQKELPEESLAQPAPYPDKDKQKLSDVNEVFKWMSIQTNFIQGDPLTEGESNAANAQAFDRMLDEYNKLDQQTIAENMAIQQKQAFWNPLKSKAKKRHIG